MISSPDSLSHFQQNNERFSFTANIPQHNNQTRNSLIRLDSEFEQENDENLQIFAERFTSSFLAVKKLPPPEIFASIPKTYPSHKFCVYHDNQTQENGKSMF